MTRCVAVLGQTGVGKSALVDSLATLEGGKPPAPAANEIRCVTTKYLDEKWALLDCPGSLELIQQSMDALLAADAAVLCLSPDPEHAVLAAPYLRLLESTGLPHVMFVNRVDEASARMSETIGAIQEFSTAPVVMRQVPMREDDHIVGAVDLVSERAWHYGSSGRSDLIEIPSDLADREQEARQQLLEGLSDYDDWLLEEIIEDRTPANDAVYMICSRLLKEHAIVPAFFGSALNGNGMNRLFKALRHEVPAVSEREGQAAGGVRAVAFATRHKQHVGKIVSLRLLAGTLAGNEHLGGATVGTVSAPFDDKPIPVTKAEAGDVVMAVKADHLNVGRLYSADGEANPPDWYKPFSPLYSRRLAAKADKDEVRLAEAIAKLSEGDTALQLTHDAETGHLIVSGQGALHLRHAREMLSNVFGVETTDDDVETSFRETITQKADVHYRHKKQSGGAGQFADIRITAEPLDSGSGFQFTQTIHGGSVPTNYIPAVEAGTRDGLARGPLGFPVVDLKVNLYDGQYHSVDSSDMAFRIAARAGIAQALSEAGPVLLEPIYDVTFHVPSHFTGSLNPLVSEMRGQVLGFDRDPDGRGWDIFRTQLPGKALSGLIADLRSITRGVGRYDAEFSHYQAIYGADADAIVTARAQAA